MSSQIGSELFHLAPELVKNVVKQVNDKKDLAGIRLACNTLDKHVAKELFKDVYISLSGEHVTFCNSIGQDDLQHSSVR
jgi:hypothetical protein